MKGEIVSTHTQDRVRLHGLYCAPVGPEKTRFDAAVLTHGLAGNFYSSRFLFYIAHTLLDLGIHVVIGNTRGHDDVNRTVRSGRSAFLGGAFEVVSECQYDLPAWNEFLLNRGPSKTILVGHSLGAIKSLYAHAHNPQPNIEAIIGLSATRLNYDRLMESSGRDAFVQTLQQAQLRVDGGKSDELMKVEFPFPTMMAAGAYLDKYGNSNQYDWLQFANQINVPAQLLFGELELTENAAFEGLSDEFAGLQESNPLLNIDVINGADHFYSARFSQAADCIREWLIQQ